MPRACRGAEAPLQAVEQRRRAGTSERVVVSGGGENMAGAKEGDKGGNDGQESPGAMAWGNPNTAKTADRKAAKSGEQPVSKDSHGVPPRRLP